MSQTSIAATAAAILVAITVTGCSEPTPPPNQPRPVRTITIKGSAQGELVSLTGHVEAREQVNLAFRIGGRIVERPVKIGDTLASGQIIARLDSDSQQNNLLSAQAELSSAEAVLKEAGLAYERQQKLLKEGWTTRANFDAAAKARNTAQAKVDSARAQLNLAKDQLGYTTLYADSSGTITAVGAKSGEVVQPGQMVVQLARKGGVDAVFDVPEHLIRTGPRDASVRIVLTNDPNISATGHIREVSPEADPATRTFQVKVGIADAPDAMHLGATVTGSIRLAAPSGMDVPSSALTEKDGLPAVWLVDPKSQAVSLQRVKTVRYDPATVVISEGLHPGDVVVTAGVQALHPGQKVRLLGASE